MANNYCSSSSFIPIPEEKNAEVNIIITKVQEHLQEKDDYVGFIAILDEKGIWIYDEEKIDMNHVDVLVKALVEELDLPGIHICSWAYKCSKPRIDEFGGVQKGKETI